MPDLSTWPDTSRLRSGTVARLAGLPVTTLRVWERRYGVVAAPKSATGHRQYTVHDVQRLRLLKQLTEQGHAIGSIATLPLSALQSMGRGAPVAVAATGPLRAVVVGRGLAHRLAAAAVPALVTVHDDLAEAEAQTAEAGRVDVLLVHLPSLQPDGAERVRVLGAHWRASTAVVYGYAAAPLLAALRDAGVAVHRDPVDGATLARWLAGVQAASAAHGPTAPRRYGDAALAALAELPSTVACECPRHLAGIVAQLAGFERYSADCGASHPADAALHRELQALAGAARTRFEQALEQIVRSEGLRPPAAAA